MSPTQERETIINDMALRMPNVPIETITRYVDGVMMAEKDNQPKEELRGSLNDLVYLDTDEDYGDNSGDLGV